MTGASALRPTPAMTPDAFHAAALALPAATFDLKWGDDAVFSVGGKMFAAYGPIGGDVVGYRFKASDMGFELLVEQGVARPAPYAARFKWVQLVSADALPDKEVEALVAQAHGLVAAGLTRKARAALGLAA